MKKLALTIAIVLGMGMSVFAQGRSTNNESGTEGTGLFGLGVSFFNREGDLTLFTDYSEYEEEEDWESGTDWWYSQGGNGLFGLGAGLFNNRGGDGLVFPGLPGFTSTDDEDAPLGSGIVLLAGLGAAYLVAKKRKED